MVDLVTALATAAQAIKLAQDLRGIDKAIDAAEYKLKIADLTNALSDIKIALTDAKEELASKDAEPPSSIQHQRSHQGCSCRIAAPVRCGHAGLGLRQLH
jgi:hypothetical protein